MKTLLWVFGIVFILVGLLGFIDNPLAGEGAFFETNTAHDVVHLLFGLVFILAALFAREESAPSVLITVGVLYLLVAVVGFIQAPSGGTVLGLIETNMADHWLHVGLGVVLIGLGYSARQPRMQM